MIRRMKSDNPTWGAPRVHGELLQLGFAISEPTVSRYGVKLVSKLLVSWCWRMSAGASSISR